MIFIDEEQITIVERASAPDALSHLVECDWLRVIEVHGAFARRPDGATDVERDYRERVTRVATTTPQYVRAVLARMYREDKVLWYT